MHSNRTKFERNSALTVGALLFSLKKKTYKLKWSTVYLDGCLILICIVSVVKEMLPIFRQERMSLIHMEAILS